MRKIKTPSDLKRAVEEAGPFTNNIRRETMEKFIKLFGEAHLNYLNVALYQTDNGASAVCEHVVNGKTLGAKKFSSVEAAEDWWSGVDGRSAGKLGNAIDELDFASRAAG